MLLRGCLILSLEKELGKMKRMNGLDLLYDSLCIQKQNSTISSMDIDILISCIIIRIGTITLEILKFIVAYLKGLILCMIQ